MDSRAEITEIHTLTAYAVIIGFAMTALMYIPDIPFFLMGLASLTLILFTKLRGMGQKEMRTAH
jgi:hypothetical protein